MDFARLRPPARPSSSFGSDDAALSEVLGKILMIAITVSLLGGFGALVLTTVSQDAPEPPAASFTMEPAVNTTRVDVRLVSGGAVELAGSTLGLTVDGTSRVSSYFVTDAATSGWWGAGETLRVNLSGAALSGGQNVIFLVADQESATTIGMAYATVPTATSGAAILQNAMGLTLAFDRSPLVADGVTSANATLNVTATHGLLLVDHVSLNLSPVGGTSDLRLYDDGVHPDQTAGDGTFTAPFSVGNHTFTKLPGHANVTLSATVRDVLDKSTSTTGTLYLVSPTPSKVGAGVVYRNIGSSGTVSTSGYVNLSAFSFRDTSVVESDQVELRVSDLTDSTKVWSALISLDDSGACSGPGVTSIVLRRDGVAGNVTYTPAGGCFLIDANARLNLANVTSSLNASGSTAAWTTTGTAATYQYAAAGIGTSNEALVAFFGDTVSTSPFARGISQSDFSWAPPVDTSGAGVPAAISTLAGTAGNGYVDLTWSAPSDGGSAISSYRIYVDGALVASTGTNTTFRVNSLTNGVSYNFTVRAVNAVGEGADSNTVTKTPASTPSAPTSFGAVKGNASVTLSWSAPSSTGGSAITDYNVYVGTSLGNTTWLASTGGTNTSFVVNGLTNGVQYYFNVTASNANGQGASTSTTSTTPSTVPNPPATLVATAGNGQVSLSWTAGSTGGSPLTDHRIYRGTSSGATTLLASTGSGANTTFLDATAQNGVAYYYNVTALNVNGVSASSNEVSATPTSSTTTPGAPQSLTATRGNQSVSLSWSAPSSDGGSAITDYCVYRGTSSGATTFLGCTGGSNTSYVAAGLTNGQVYYFNVTAVNSVGQGNSSAEASATPAGVPYPPTGLTPTPGNGTVSLSWSAPANTGGLTITNYHVYRGTSSGATTYLGATGGSNTSYVAAGLTNGVTYFFNVTAATAVGQGTSSAETSATPSTTPNPPSGLSATAGNGSVSLSWSAGSNGGSAITGYDIYRGTSSGAATYLATIGTNTSYVATGLTNGQTYYFNVTALNANGGSASSNEASATPAGVPNPPTGLAATKGNGSVSLSWTAPGVTGGATITTYNVYRGTSSGATSYIATTGGTNTSFVANGLTNGQVYYFNVTAVNAIGQSAGSNEASATPSTVPNPPTSLSATRGNQSASLSWTAPASNGGSAISDYNVYVGTASGGTSYTASTGGTNTSFVVNGLTNGVTYYFNVTAVNANGQSSTSNEANVLVATVPDPPATFTATAGTDQVALSWTAGSTGGSAITGYEVWRGTSSGGETLLATIGTNTSYTDANAVGGTTYWYYVKAVNAVGSSSGSVERSATPTSAGSVPGAPTALNLTAATGRVNLTWTAPGFTGGSPITGYKVYRSTTNSTGSMALVTTIGTNTSYNDLGLTNNVTYYYQVRAVNANGDGNLTSIKDATPRAINPINCATVTATSGSMDCTGIQLDDGVLADLRESRGATKILNISMSLNMSGVTGTQTLAIQGNPNNAPESLLVQALNVGTGAYDTIITFPSTASTQATYTGSMAASTYWPNGVLTIRLLDGEVNNAQSSWDIDYLAVITS